MTFGGRQLGPYRIERELARGGMGVVYEAVHVSSKARVALKMLELKGLDADGRQRFEREAQAQARLDHPAIVRVHTACFDDPPYLVQDYLPGGSLAERLKAKGPLEPAEALAVVRRVGHALVHAHARAVLHRDLKPDNVLFDEHGQACLADFGLAGVRGSSKRLTRTGEVMGTPAYMAPEQASDAKRVDARADVYGLGALLYACLSGRGPFSHKRGVIQTLNAVIHEEPAPVRQLRPDVPPELEAVCIRALAKLPAQRYPDVQAMLEALGPLEQVAVRQSRLRLWPGLGLLAVVVTAGTWAAAFRAQSRLLETTTAVEQAATPKPDPLAVALAALEAGESPAAALVKEAATRVERSRSRGSVIDRLERLHRSPARDRLLATALAFEGRLSELGRWGGNLGPLPQSLRRVESRYQQLEESLADSVLNPDLDLLRERAEELIACVVAAPPGPARRHEGRRAQIHVARTLGRLSLGRRPPEVGLYQRGSALAPDGTSRAQLEVAYAYSLARSSGSLYTEQVTAILDRWASTPGLDTLALHWRALIEARLRNGGEERWGPDQRGSEALRRAAFDRLQVPESGLNDEYRIGGEVLAHSLALDLLRTGWTQLFESDGRRGHEHLAAIEGLTVSAGRRRTPMLVECVRHLLTGDLAGFAAAEFSLHRVRDRSARKVLEAEAALIGPTPDYALARGLFEQSLADGYPSAESVLGLLHVRVLQGELTKDEALTHEDHGRIPPGEDWLGCYWHQPEFFERTLRGGWWPGKQP